MTTIEQLAADNLRRISNLAWAMLPPSMHIFDFQAIGFWHLAARWLEAPRMGLADPPMYSFGWITSELAALDVESAAREFVRRVNKDIRPVLPVEKA